MSPRPTGDPKPLPTEGVNPELVAAYQTIRTTVVPSTRIEGWNGPRQRRFLEAVADGETVRDACRSVQLSPQSAYAFRRTARGAGFDLGWKAADLLARERVAADLMIRAVEGQEQETTRADGSVVTRTYKCNRLALAMLNRLDRYADASERTAPGHAARLVAGDFDSFLQLVGDEGGPARAGLYMLAHNADGEGTAAELEPVVALARADRLLRCGTATDVAIADLDPARRADWTADQWARAEAAGIIALAPPPAPEPAPQESASTRQPASTCPSHADLNARDLAALDKLRRLGLPTDGHAPPGPDPLLNSPVWYDKHDMVWRTWFPPPAGFDGEEDHEFGHPNYERTLTPEEEEIASRRLGAHFGIWPLEEAEVERNEWFRSADESGDRVDAAAASPAGGPDPLTSSNLSDVEGEAALVLSDGAEPATRPPVFHPETPADVLAVQSRAPDEAEPPAAASSPRVPRISVLALE